MNLRRIEAAVALVIHAERALVLRRRPTDRSFANQWCLPGGRVEVGEAPEQTAVRETAEETGLVVCVEHVLGERVVELPERGIEFLIHCFAAIAPDDRVVLSDEHVASRWLTREEAARASVMLPDGIAGDVGAELLVRFSGGAL